MSSYILVLEDDRDIIQEYSSGNTEAAATAFVRKYQSFVFATALRYLQNYDDADDASQEVFIKALRNLHKFRGDSSLKTWLYRITSNVCTNMYRKRRVLSFFKHEETENYIDLPSDEISPEQILENKDFEKNFMEILAKLPERQRETFALRYFENLTYEEISNMLGTSVGGLKSNYFHAVRKIAELLKNK